MTSSESTHWCHHCSEPVWPQGQDSLCPYCDGGFVQELPVCVGTHPGDAYGEPSDHPTSDSGIMGYISSLARHIMPEMDPNFGAEIRPGMLPERSVGVGPWPHCPMLIFHGHPPPGAPHQDPFGHPIVVPHHDPFGHPMGIHHHHEATGYGSPGTGPRHDDDYDHFDGEHGLPELTEQLSMDDTGGPPPAAQSAIDALPTIRISQRHLNSEAKCPVCQEKYELGSEARQMPCEHIYHSSCIVPWLVRHNTCPVCRLELPRGGSGSGRSNRNRRSGNASSSRRHNNFRSHRSRNPFSCLWPQYR